MTTGTALVLGAPTDFMAGPGRWMEWMSTYGGTATAGPNFSYVLAARALRRGDAARPVPPADRAQRRRAGRPRRRSAAFVEAGERHGLRPGAVFPAFGMAEVAIAGTFPEPMSGLRTDAVDRRVLEAERYAAPVDAGAPTAPASSPSSAARCRASRSASSTRSPATCCSDREVGELEIRGTSVTPGYYKRPDANAELFHDGWLRTGDLAYLLDGEMVMCGRIKDMIIVGGRNVFPEDVERALGRRRRRAGRQRHRLRRRRRPGQGGPRRGGREQGRRPRRGAPLGGRAGARRHRPAGQGDRARRARQPAQDELRQAPALAVQGPLPRRRSSQAV